MTNRSSREHQVVVHPEIASETSLLQNIAEYVPVWISQSYSGQSEEHKERVLWTKFQQLDEYGFSNRIGNEESKGPPPLILILGYSSGYSVWTIKGGTGEAQEVVAQHGTGQVRMVTLLNTPDRDIRDSYSEQRPLLAVVSKPFDTLVPFSLGEGRDLGKKHHISFKASNSEPGGIVNIVSNSRYVVVVLQTRITVLDAGNLTSFLFYVKNQCAAAEYPSNPVALGSQWLAYTSSALDSPNQSQGGVFNEEGVSVTAKVLDTMGGIYRVLSNYWKGEPGTEGPRSSSSSTTVAAAKPQQPATSGQNTAVVTVLDIQRVYHKVAQQEGGVVKVDLKKMDRDSGVIAHFLAYQEPERRVVAMAFDPSGLLLLTACNEGRVFNLYKILPHPWHSSETCVQHLYKLLRGDTTSTVQSLAFSPDSRWVAVSTLRGTTHVFPITPFGGPITKRTHLSSKVVNRSGRFHITAGLTDPKLAPPNLPSVFTPPLAPPTSEQSYNPDIAFSLHHLGNPHVFSLLERPVKVIPLVQIKQLSQAAPVAEGDSPRSKPPLHAPSPPQDCPPGLLGVAVATVFADSRGQWKDGGSSLHALKRAEPVKSEVVPSLFVASGSSSAVTEHVLGPRVAREARGLQERAARTGPDDAPIELESFSRLSWKLSRPTDTKCSYCASPSCNPLLRERGEGQGVGVTGPPRLTSEEWLANVEVLTHEEPPRRLWMGPQFVMKTYSSSGDRDVGRGLQGTSISEAEGEDKQQREAAVVCSPVLPTEKDEELLLQSLRDARVVSSQAMMIPRGGRGAVAERGGGREEGGNVIDTGPSSLGPEYVECFGSWKDQIPSKNGYHSPQKVSKELEEAMKDGPNGPRLDSIPVRLPSTPDDEFHDPLSQ